MVDCSELNARLELLQRETGLGSRKRDIQEEELQREKGSRDSYMRLCIPEQQEEIGSIMN